jgi:hypothetical protein
VGRIGEFASIAGVNGEEMNADAGPSGEDESEPSTGLAKPSSSFQRGVDTDGGSACGLPEDPDDMTLLGLVGTAPMRGDARSGMSVNGVGLRFGLGSTGCNGLTSTAGRSGFAGGGSTGESASAGS